MTITSCLIVLCQPILTIPLVVVVVVMRVVKGGTSSTSTTILFTSTHLHPPASTSLLQYPFSGCLSPLSPRGRSSAPSQHAPPSPPPHPLLSCSPHAPRPPHASPHRSSGMPAISGGGGFSGLSARIILPDYAG